MSDPKRGKTSAASTPGSFAPHSRSEADLEIAVSHEAAWEARYDSGLSDPDINQLASDVIRERARALLDGEVDLVFDFNGGDEDGLFLQLVGVDGADFDDLSEEDIEAIDEVLMENSGVGDTGYFHDGTELPGMLKGDDGYWRLRV